MAKNQGAGRRTGSLGPSAAADRSAGPLWGPDPGPERFTATRGHAMHTYEIPDLAEYDIEVHMDPANVGRPRTLRPTLRFRADRNTYVETPSGSLSIRMRTPAEAPADGPEVALIARGEWHAVTLVLRQNIEELMARAGAGDGR